MTSDPLSSAKAAAPLEHRSGYRIELFPLEQIRPTEEHAPAHAEALRQDMEITGLWTHPLLVDQAQFALMDGHHRYHAARQLQLICVPVILLSYDDPMVELQSWRPGDSYRPQDIWDLCATGRLLPMKSTRHVIHAQLPFSRIPLARLREAKAIGQEVPAVAAHPSRVQLLSSSYHGFGARIPLRTASAAALDVETASSLVPHDALRQRLEQDPAMAALMTATPCRIALGRQEDFPFRLVSPDLLLLPPSLLDSSAALAACARWGMEAAFAWQQGAPGAARLAALIRHGAALMQALPHEARALLQAHAPQGLPAALTSSLAEAAAIPAPAELGRPELHGPELLAWMAHCIGLPQSAAETGTSGQETGKRGSNMGGIKDLTLALQPLEAPVESLLISNSDSRLHLDPETGKNKYGTTPRPRPKAVHFSSSTASSISSYGFLYCDVLRRDLLNHVLEGSQDPRRLRSSLCQALVQELCTLCGIGPGAADGVIAPSGTDTELLAVLLARAADPETPLVNILISPAETGRGVRLAGAGKYFDEQSATGAAIAKGVPVWDDARIDLAEIPLRDSCGRRLALAKLDAAFLKAGRAALARGARVLAHVLIGSKTGLCGPSAEAVDALCAEAPERVDVVVDACQMRVDFAQLGQWLERGWMLQVSGSKSLTGPPFSGALLMPQSYRRRAEAARGLMRPGICYPEDWNGWWAGRMGESTGVPPFGAPLRWLPALLETKLLEQVPQALRSHALDTFRQAVTQRLEESPYLEVYLPGNGPVGTGPEVGQLARHSIMSFQVRVPARPSDTGPGAPLTALDELGCRHLFETLNSDASALLPMVPPPERALLRQEFHIGQPVVLGQGKDSHCILRLVVGMRFYNIVAHAGPGAARAALESEISDLLRAIGKLEILARHWHIWTGDR
ncbi:ParB N-terminal domain-containing protein [Leisingera sp. ANG59]|uniref:ParB N-terminal domain-containing protein n=1 Tax=Leisingera sp. ANG59 TaxID=2675221 RepID=UPI00157278F6|nr:ParB N-terminal domain-containing protein [Leisingera sp. ANG59]NSY39542.1 hypothetical protein [Leisingera sp. ANG59]